MEHVEFDPHLSQMSTQWTMVFQAHSGTPDEAHIAASAVDVPLCGGRAPVPAQSPEGPRRRRRARPGVRPAISARRLPEQRPQPRPISRLREARRPEPDQRPLSAQAADHLARCAHARARGRRRRDRRVRAAVSSRAGGRIYWTGPGTPWPSSRKTPASPITPCSARKVDHPDLASDEARRATVDDAEQAVHGRSRAPDAAALARASTSTICSPRCAPASITPRATISSRS